MTIKYIAPDEKWFIYYQDKEGQDCHFILDEPHEIHDIPGLIRMIRHTHGSGVVVFSFSDFTDIKKLYNACSLISMKAKDYS